MRQAVLLLLLINLISACTPGSPVEFLDSENNKTQVSDYHGKWVVLSYWSEWCPPCLKEIPELNQLHKVGQQAKQPVHVFGINADAMPANALNASKAKLAIEYQLLQNDPAKKLGIKPITVLPAAYILDPKGKLHGPLIGPQTKKSIEAALVKLGFEDHNQG